LFYLAWARIPYLAINRPAAEDFYAEPFVLPEGAAKDSATHVRWSKYGTTLWSEIKIYPAPDVSSIGTQIDLPIYQERDSYPFHDPTTADLFEALAKELAQPESKMLTALWFLMEACYRSPSRSSLAEDIQSICTALEALLNVQRKGYSSEQVFDKLNVVFDAQAPSAEDGLCSRSPAPERAEVIERLGQWIAALYEIRNAYSHGKAVENYLFVDRSIWQDSFEVFRLAANRVILQRPEPRGGDGSLLEKRLMSVTYFDDAVGALADKKWMETPQPAKISHLARVWQIWKRVVDSLFRKDEPERPDILREAIRKGRVLDPELVESISGLKRLRQALYNICSITYLTLKQTDFSARTDSATLESFLKRCEQAYSESRRSTGFDVDSYIRKTGPALSSLLVSVPLFTRKDVYLFELVSPFKNLLMVYQNFTKMIVKSAEDEMDCMFDL
jgi:hypothetical protein